MTYRRLLGRRLLFYCWVRAAVAMMIVIAALVARHGLGMEDLHTRALYSLAGILAFYNVGAWLFFRRFQDEEGALPVYERILLATYGAVVLDFLALTLAIWLVGGCRSPFVAYYLLHVIVSSILLSRRGAISLMVLAYALLVLLVLAEWTGLSPPHLPAGAIVGAGPLPGRFAVTVLVAYGMLFGLASFLLLGLNMSLRRGERRIHMANSELRRLSEQRKDFLHIAVHNLKSPLGAVTMFLKNILDGLGGPVTDKQQEWIGRSLKRLDEQSKFLVEMQMLSSLEDEIISSTYTRVELDDILKELVEEYSDVAEQQLLVLRLRIERPVPAVLGHGRLLREAVVNYLTNALKFTPEGGHIQVRLLHRDPMVRVEVVDDGPGIAEVDRPRLFREFMRATRPGAAARKNRGSGLGLSLVRKIVESHGGYVGVDSEEGRGSTFYFELPPLLE